MPPEKSAAPPFSANRYLADLRAADLIRQNGKVRQVIGVVVESNGPSMSIGETAHIIYKRNADPVVAEAVGFRDRHVLLMPLGELGGISAGSDVVSLGKPLQVALSPALLGRVLDGLGRPLDGKRPHSQCGVGANHRRSTERVDAPPGRYAAIAGRSCHRRTLELRPRSARRHICRQRRRQVDRAGHDRAQYRGRRQRHCARR